ncbi:hypothetical protein M0R45_013029 [Rubus argutus]|uniref:NPH3 domain-containing protein n=1 Tax=Rubus argutus TaxID=59490 RepID=A0AAW1XI23_RUBAR
MVIRSMISKEIELSTVFKFLFRYHHSKCFGATPVEKCKITEVVISLLSLFDRSSLSCKGLFNIYQVALSNEFPSPRGKKYVYDVNLALRFGKSFLVELRSLLIPEESLEKGRELMDSYLAEVAPDPHLNPSKFAALVLMLPDSARQSHDRLYQPLLYILSILQRHTDLYEQEKLTICCALNYKKLSAQALKQVSKHSKFPSRRAVEAFKTQQSKQRSLLQEVCYVRTKDEKEEIESTQVTNVIKSRVPFRGTNIGYLPKLFP